MGVFRSFDLIVKGASPLSRALPEEEALQAGGACLRAFIAYASGKIDSAANIILIYFFVPLGTEYSFMKSSNMLLLWFLVYSAAEDAAWLAIIFMSSAP